MDQIFNIPDSTDWLDTPLSTLAPLESSLRCQVCKDFFDNPVITSCCHSFCSLCIRRCLSVEGKCPTCRSGDQELKLRRNWALQEVVDSFKNARPNVLQFMKDAVAATEVPENGGAEEDDIEEPATKRRRIAPPRKRETESMIRSGGRKTRSQSRRMEDAPDETLVVEDSQDEDYVPELEPGPEPEPNDGLVACPMCFRRMKNEAVFSHLDNCTGSVEQPQPQQPSRQNIDQQNSSKQTKHLERLPKINYSLLKDNVLRKKLRELGIPDWGNKPLLQKRHTEWMNLWNANCDSKIPKTTKELLRELDIWEKAQGGRAAVPTGSSASNSVMRKDFDGAAWSASHEDNFKNLIENAKMKRGTNMTASKPKSPSISDGIVSPPPKPESPPVINESVSPGAILLSPNVAKTQEPQSPLRSPNEGQQSVQHHVVDLTEKDTEGIVARADSGPETQGPRVHVVPGSNANFDSI